MIWRWFTLDEFQCNCGCGRADMSHDFIDKLDELRERVGFPLVVTSGYRCPDHNDKVSSTGRSGPHTTGRAADIAIMGHKAHKVLQQASLGGWFTGIGLKQHGSHAARFMHLDDLEQPNSPRPNIWTYT